MKSIPRVIVRHHILPLLDTESKQNLLASQICYIDVVDVEVEMLRGLSQNIALSPLQPMCYYHRTEPFGIFGNSKLFDDVPTTFFWFVWEQLWKDRPYCKESIKQFLSTFLVPHLIDRVKDFFFLDENDIDYRNDPFFKELRSGYVRRTYSTHYIEPCYVYFTVCIMDWYLPRYFGSINANGKVNFDFGCIKRHRRWRGRLLKIGLHTAAESLFDNERFNMDHTLETKCMVSRVMRSILENLHPVHHFEEAVELMLRIHRMYEDSFVFPRIWHIAGFVNMMGGIFRVPSIDNGIIHRLPLEMLQLWQEDIERCEKEKELVSKFVFEISHFDMDEKLKLVEAFISH